MVYTLLQFVRLFQEYDVRLRGIRSGPFPPVYYALAKSKLDGEPVMLMWLDQARCEWVAFDPDEAEDDVRELMGIE